MERHNIAIDDDQHKKLKSIKINNVQTSMRIKVRMAIDLLLEKFRKKK